MSQRSERMRREGEDGTGMQFKFPDKKGDGNKSFDHNIMQFNLLSISSCFHRLIPREWGLVDLESE